MTAGPKSTAKRSKEASAEAGNAMAKKARTAATAVGDQDQEVQPAPAAAKKPVSKKKKAEPAPADAAAAPPAVKKARKGGKQEAAAPALVDPPAAAPSKAAAHGEASAKRRAVTENVTYKEKTERARPSDYVVVKTELEVTGEAEALADTKGDGANVGVRRRWVATSHFLLCFCPGLSHGALVCTGSLTLHWWMLLASSCQWSVLCCCLTAPSLGVGALCFQCAACACPPKAPLYPGACRRCVPP